MMGEIQQYLSIKNIYKEKKRQINNNNNFGYKILKQRENYKLFKKWVRESQRGWPLYNSFE